MTDGNGSAYKDTLNLPQTAFPMRGNLPKREPEFLERWQEQQIYHRWQEREGDTFILHDGPPYANGEIHIGHALNKVLKDIVVKYRSLRGDRVPFVPGWDCHGLPIETQVSKKLGKKVRELSDTEFRQACREYAEQFVDIQRNAFRRLGVFADWDNPYLTMDFGYEAETLRRLADLVEGGYLFRRRKPVAWSIENRTALAEAELEYHDKDDLSVYVLFPVPEPPPRIAQGLPDGATVYLMIWTTTPWTLPANLAVAANPDLDYGIYPLPDPQPRYVVLATDRAAEVLGDGESTPEPVRTLRGAQLAGIVYDHPFVERQGTVVEAEFVSATDGTGLVHIAPGHGADDYEVGLREGLDIYCPVRDDGTYDDTVPEWLRGEHVWKANSQIAEHLEKTGLLFRSETLRHSYPHDWRSKKPIIFRATAQWFISMDANKLRERALKAIDATSWVPAWGYNRIHAMVQHRPDWCISRQRRWGVPIAVPFCTQCNEPLLDPELMRHVALQFEAEGADAWFNRDVHDFLPDGSRCAGCGGTDFVRGNDILDVWFDSGISWAAVLEQRPDLHAPSDLYLEGSDQHRGWFQSSLLLGVALRDHAPYKQVLTHGFVMDGKGHKMSKSAGNVVDPAKIVKQYGAEILRAWIASEQYEDDMRISDEILRGVVDVYRKIRNTFRFLAGNLYDFDPERDRRTIEALQPVDRWMLHRLLAFERELIAAYDEHAFHRVFQKAGQFCIVDLSALYLDLAKDRLYCGGANSPERRSAQTVLYRAARSLARLLAPILSFTTEELWQHLPGDATESVFLSKIEPPLAFSLSETELREWEHLLTVRQDVQKLLETRRANKEIGHSLEAKVYLGGRGIYRKLLDEYADLLPEWLIVSQVEVVPFEDERLTEQPQELLRIGFARAEGNKCARCWQYHPAVGTLPHPDLCPRCDAVITAIEQAEPASS
ncbi:MAG: isoleucine--tRNA ligase [Candidatus Dadabacteria bacterium]|nr:MAG: isoleucine--tRNA ligase [Candidatus Dadabacteria bacterium]